MTTPPTPTSAAAKEASYFASLIASYVLHSTFQPIKGHSRHAFTGMSHKQIETLIQANIDQITADLQRQLAEYQRVLDSRREQVFVNAYPDAELPVRILSAYLDDSTFSSEPPELAEVLNKVREERNVILHAAIAALSAIDAAAQQAGKEGA